MQLSLLITLVLLLSQGAFLAAAGHSERRAAARTSPPAGCSVVRGSGTKSGEFSNITSAIAAISKSKDPNCIFVYGGTYREHVDVKISGPLTIYGYTTNTGSYKNNEVTLTNNLGSYDAGSLDASATLNARTANFTAYNINFVNEYTSGQAVALCANGNYQGYYGCSFVSYQDTLYAKSGIQYYSNCYIKGAVDYIFGDASAWFGECIIASSGGGYITASSRTYDNDTAWYAIDHSTITQKSGVNVQGKVYLGRPWRVLARVIYQYSSLTAVVNPAGWTTMAEGATPVFMEYQNLGAGADTSQRQYATTPTAAVTKKQLWGELWQWYDTTY